MRWDRALAYAEEIRIDLGEHPDRREPDLPEFEEVKQLMRRKFAQRKENHG